VRCQLRSSVHFYGSKWPAEMEKPGFPDELAWHFAHEAAHLYQRHTSTTSGDDWITEGSAEAFAAMALRADASAYVHSAEEKALGKCREFLKGRSGSRCHRCGNIRCRLQLRNADQSRYRFEGTACHEARWPLCSLAQLSQRASKNGVS
jgi:hypothetical protein